MSYRPEEIEALVRQVINRVMGEAKTHPLAHASGKRPLLTADHIQLLGKRDAKPEGEAPF